MGDGDSWLTGGVVGIGDTIAHGRVSLAVETAGLTLAGMAGESGAGAVVALVSTLVAVPSMPPPFPCDEAEEKWEDLARSIRDSRTEISNLVGKEGVDADWEGPAADAFCHYINNTLLPAMDQLAHCADEEAGCCNTVSSGLVQGLIIHLAQCTAGILLCIFANSLAALPVVGAFLVALAKWIIVDSWVVGVMYNVYDMYNSLMTLEGEQSQLQAAQNKLATGFATEADRFDAKALESIHREVEPIMQDAKGWNKP